MFKQCFVESWQVILNVIYIEVKFDSKMMYIDVLVDKEIGMLVSFYGVSYFVVGGMGWNSGKCKVDVIDFFVDGVYELFGCQYNMMFGGSYSKQNNCYFSVWVNVFLDDIGNFSVFNGNFF